MTDNAGPKPQKRQKFLPLREITLNSRPLVKRAIQFSCDGDLAVAADDSVHVFVPEFPDLTARRKTHAARTNGHPTDGSSSEDEDEADDAGPKRYNHQALRAQYSEGSKHMPVSFPPLDPHVNRELFTAQDLPFPYESATGHPATAGDDSASSSAGSDNDAASDDAYDSQDSAADAEGAANLGFNRPYGAGYGPITGVGSSMNHVVALGWSPSGLGVNRRPVLAVLTAAGTLGMFGDGAGGRAAAAILARANAGMLQRRELNGWVVLWGVGERLVVPGQQTEVSEYLRGFAWAGEIAPGQALLATVNDVREVAVISVQSVFVGEQDGAKGDASVRAEPRESVVWLVREVARFRAQGPHEAVEPWDSDWTPHGTSFSVKWGPWLQDGDTRTCVVSYVDRNYVGFRRVTITEPWVRGEHPSLQVDSGDVSGICTHLSTDAFVEFEDTIWTQGPVSSCRGLISTGFDLKQFDIALSGGSEYHVEKHNVWNCGTVYREEAEHGSQNPIIDLVIHPPDLNNPSPTPLYTLIRMTASATTKDWYQTNLPSLGDSTGDPRPQWVRTIAQKLEVQVPLDMHLTRRYDDDASDASASGSEDNESDLGMADDLDSLADEENGNGEDDTVAVQVPEIHPHRFRLHGLTLSPGAGVSAVLASTHSTQHPERGGWHTVRSSVLFAHKPRRRRPKLITHPAHPDYGLPIDPEVMNMDTNTDIHSNHLTTEAKLFEHLYGGGPEVPGVHYPATDPNPSCTTPPTTGTPTAVSMSMRTLFAAALAIQTCELCNAPLDVRRGALSGCARGHFFGTCATSGLAVQAPGATRSCGACGLRSMRPEVMVAKMPVDMREEARRVVGDGVCGACGGKFLS